ncbi:MAG: 16S rRNA (uracil(1498)-N(3))-methyltransferase [Rhodospirillales bacterium]
MASTPSIRLFVDEPLRAGSTQQLSRPQSHYLVNVMRCRQDAPVILFNGYDGEWHTEIAVADKKACVVSVLHQTRPQSIEPDIWLVFAPLKKDRTDFLIEKATELGVARLIPAVTRRTQNARLNADRLLATATEAAEQSKRLSRPDIVEPATFDDIIRNWPENRRLIYLDETGQGQPLARVLAEGVDQLAFWIGPEGGFTADELDVLGKLTFSVAADLGPRILRAETAATAALAIRQSVADLHLSTEDRRP